MLKIHLLLLLLVNISCTEDPSPQESRDQDSSLSMEIQGGMEARTTDLGLREDLRVEETQDMSLQDLDLQDMNSQDLDVSLPQRSPLDLGVMHANQSLDEALFQREHPHRFDVYLPDTAPSRVIVFLHGGLGSKESIAEKLGLRTDAQIHQDQINSLGAAWIIPQGQAIEREGLAIPTWSNHVMFSGTNDLLFLNDLSTWIRSNWSGIPLVLSGHSNGGMMTHRVWCEAPELYSLYVGVSGPPSTSYDPDYPEGTHLECLGGPPYWAIIGSEDRTIGVNENPNWTISVSNSDVYERSQDHVMNEKRAHEELRSLKVCQLIQRGEETEQNGLTQWSSCNGRVVLWWVNQPEPNRLEARGRTYGHKIDSLESAGQFILREELTRWSPDLP